jgi:hypothetical protein
MQQSKCEHKLQTKIEGHVVVLSIESIHVIEFLS